MVDIFRLPHRKYLAYECNTNLFFLRAYKECQIIQHYLLDLLYIHVLVMQGNRVGPLLLIPWMMLRGFSKKPSRTGKHLMFSFYTQYIK